MVRKDFDSNVNNPFSGSINNNFPFHIVKGRHEVVGSQIGVSLILGSPSYHYINTLSETTLSSCLFAGIL